MQGRTYRIGPGQAFVALVPEAVQYGYAPGASVPWVFSWLNVYDDFGLHLWRGFRDQFGPVNPLPPGSSAGLALSRLLKVKTGGGMQDPYEEGEGLYSFFVRWWRQLSGSQPPSPGIGRVARQYLDENYAEPLNVKELAAKAGCSREHFTRLFVRDTGQSPALYLRLRRLEAGQRLLLQSRLSLEEVARRCGFASARQFRRAHAIHFGKPVPEHPANL